MIRQIEIAIIYIYRVSLFFFGQLNNHEFKQDNTQRLCMRETAVSQLYTITNLQITRWLNP
jgi:hypothetical protein